jgi:acetyl-CoA acetyltransferase
MGLEAATRALLGAGMSPPQYLVSLRNSLDVYAPGITYDAVEAAYVSYVFGESTYGGAALYQLGLTGIPISNVNNSCAIDSVAFFHAAALVRVSHARCALALGFERRRLLVSEISPAPILQ